MLIPQSREKHLGSSLMSGEERKTTAEILLPQLRDQHDRS
jgi:hypothetical protein